MSRPPTGPPPWADRFLEWFCHPDLLEEIQGDIHELFTIREAEKGTTAARRYFAWDVIRSFRLSTVKNFDLLISPDMLKMNARIAFRQMLKQKVFTFIKIGGFALGMAACLLISLYIKDELAYDQHYAEGDRLYRMVSYNSIFPEAWAGHVFFPAPMAQALLEDYPEIESAARITPGGLFGGGSNTLRRADQQENFFEEGFLLVDHELLDVLEIPIIQGAPAEALASPLSIVISAKKAAQYFPEEDPIGKSLIINDELDKPYVISGVMRDMPIQSHLAPIDFLVTLTEVEFWQGEQQYWRANNYHTYVRLQEGTDVADLEQKLLGLVDKYYLPSTIAEGVNDPEKEVGEMTFGLQPVGDIYLKSAGIMDLLPHGDIRFVRLLGAIVIFILLLAVINFVNLSTAKSANRAREVGMRKVVGSQRGQLVQQFLTESTLISILALSFAILLAGGFLPYFNQLTDKNLVMPWLAWWFLPGALLGGLLLGIIAGFYPALFLSTFKPIDVLRGHLSRGAKSSSVRNGLVVFQFATSVVLIAGTFVIYQQMNYILNKELGFDKDQVVIIQGANTLGDQVATFKEELQRMPDVQSVSIGDYLPIDGTQRNSNRFGVDNGEQVIGQFWLVDHDYVSTLGMEVIQGRDFSRAMSTDSTGMIINEAMARELGYDNPIGHRLNNG
ncbi:MAG: ABC transporter permease, partial [Bacteroidota bacterium]